MKKWHVEQIGACELYGAEEETIFYALVECIHAKLFWAEIKNMTGIKLPRLHPSTWASDIHILDEKVCSREEVAVITRGAWSMWTSRNKLRKW